MILLLRGAQGHTVYRFFRLKLSSGGRIKSDGILPKTLSNAKEPFVVVSDSSLGKLFLRGSSNILDERVFCTTMSRQREFLKRSLM